MYSRRAGWPLLILAFASAPVTQAAPLPAGAVLLPAPVEGVPTGQVVRQVVAPFAIPGGVEGTLTTTALASDVTSPLGGLTLTYLLEVTGGPSGESIGRLTAGQFLGFATDVSVIAADGTTAPAFVDRNASGELIGMTFHPTSYDPLADFLSPGRSALLVVQTNAPNVGHGIAHLLGHQGSAVASLSINAAPEPAAWQLLAMGFAAVGCAVRWRRANRRHVVLQSLPHHDFAK